MGAASVCDQIRLFLEFRGKPRCAQDSPLYSKPCSVDREISEHFGQVACQATIRLVRCVRSGVGKKR